MSDDSQTRDRQLAELEMRRAKIREMGGKERVARQKQRGKLTARERVDRLLDEGTFREIGMFARPRGSAADKEVPGDAVVTGYGQIDGRRVYIYSQDFTSLGGTVSEIHAKKICNVIDKAIKVGCPVIGLYDCGGLRIQDGTESVFGPSDMFFKNVLASGIVPQIAAILGPCAGGASYSPALMDFIFMVKGISYSFVTGPRVVRSVLGEEVTEEELGSAVVAQRKAGVACRSENSEEECLQNIRELLSYLPSSNRERPKRIDWGDDPKRMAPTLVDIVPTDPRKPYDMHKIIEKVFDQRQDGRQNYFEVFPLFATNIITCFSRLNGRSVGIVANQPMSKAGCLDIDACDKASRFIRFCDAFNIPIVTLVDVPGYLPGAQQEWGGIIRHGAKMLYAYSEATVPMITLTIRKGYGGAYVAMCNKDMGADITFCWPTTEVAVMGPEGAAPIIFSKELDKTDNPEKLLQEKIKEYREKFASPYAAAATLGIDDVIHPAETRPLFIEALETIIDKVEERPKRKHGIMPT